MGYVISAVAVVGLAADAGYLAGPAGFLTNAVTGGAKVVVKHTPPALLKALVNSAGSAKALARVLLDYMKKLPDRPQSVTQVLELKDWMFNGIKLMFDSIERILTSPLNLNPIHYADTLGVISRNTSETVFSADGTLGAAAMIGREGTDATEDFLGMFTGAACGLSRTVCRLGDLSSDAVTAGRGKALNRAKADSEAMYERVLQWANSGKEAASRVKAISPGFQRISHLIGEGKAFKSFQELQQLRFLPPADLTPEQIEGIKQVRQAFGPIVGASEELQGTRIRKIVNGLELEDYLARGVEGGILGFVAKYDDVADLDAKPIAEVIGGLRLDRPDDNRAWNTYLEIDIPEATNEMAQASRVPKSEDFFVDDSIDRRVNLGPPNNGDGLVANTDGYLRPEYHLGFTGRPFPLGTEFLLRDETGKLMKSYEVALNGDGDLYFKLTYKRQN